jgi:hypothetical protein
MDNLDRMYRHLVRTIRSRFPQYLGQPFDVGELYQTILPYRHYRRELGLETNDDYEMTLTELLSGARDYVIVRRSHARRAQERARVDEPRPAAFKQFATVRVALSPAALRSLEAGPAMDPGTPDIAVPFLSSASERPGRRSDSSGVGSDDRASASTTGRSGAAPQRRRRSSTATRISTDRAARRDVGDTEHTAGCRKHRTLVRRSLGTGNGIDHTKCRRAV